jgi:anaerobic dimethyl sulfoxide reductase subunit B (iron-sulfur subunit)
MTQYGFFFDQSRCSGCRSCAAACKDWNNIDPGPVKWLRVLEYEKGSFPATVKVFEVFATCYHCENPVCVDAANGAMYKEDKYGAVLIDPEKANSIDLRKAQEACPYGAIQFDSDAMTATASKCTMCIDRLEQGLKPICVMSCYMRALDFGTLEDMQAKYGTARQLEDMPDPTEVKPAVVFKPNPGPANKLLPYDANKALQLLGKRDPQPPFWEPDKLGMGPIPPLYNTPSDVTDIPEGLVGRTKLVMKPKDNAEQMLISQHDEG